MSRATRSRSATGCVRRGHAPVDAARGIAPSNRAAAKTRPHAASRLERVPETYPQRGKAPFRVWMLREAVFWRLHDLMAQKHGLTQHPDSKGCLPLIRNGVAGQQVANRNARQ